MTRPSFTLCLCPDAHILRGRIDALLAAHPASSGSTWQRFTFWGDEALPTAFWDHLTLNGLFATPKVLILRNAQNMLADALKQLSSGILPFASGSGTSPAWPFICFEVAFEKGSPKVPAHITRLPLYQKAEQNGWIDNTPGLTPQAVPAYIKMEASQQGLRLRPEELSLLTAALPPDAALIASEITKLALARDAQGNLPKNAVTLIEHTQELGIFELMRAVQQHDNVPAVWRKILEDRLTGENMVFGFIAILLREARIFWQILSGTPPFLPFNIAGQKKALAQTLGFAGISKIWDLVLVADKSIKTGERSPDQTFEMLVADLFLLFKSHSFR